MHVMDSPDMYVAIQNVQQRSNRRDLGMILLHMDTWHMDEDLMVTT